VAVTPDGFRDRLDWVLDHEGCESCERRLRWCECGEAAAERVCDEAAGVCEADMVDCLYEWHLGRARGDVDVARIWAAWLRARAVAG
jgi:hypothetical protein